MENTTINNINTVIDSIEEKMNNIHNLEEQIKSQERELGCKDELVEQLQFQINELKEKQPEVRITHLERKNRGYGGENNTWDSPTITEYRNFSNVQDDIRKEIETKFEKELEDSKNKIKSLTNQLDLDKDIYARQLQRNESYFETDKLAYKLDLDKEKRYITQERDDLNVKIKNLKEELKKVKESKTDEELTKKREEEIITLRTQIQYLEKLVSELTSTNIFKRTWNALINKRARIDAQKELLEKKEEVAKIKGNNNWFYTACNSIRYNW